MASRADNLMAESTPHFNELYGVDVVINNQDAGTNPRTIKAIVSGPFDLSLREGNAALQYRTKTIQVSSRNNVEGVTDPKVRGKTTDSGGMTVVLPGDAATWYVRDIQQSDAGMHTLEIVDNDGV